MIADNRNFTYSEVEGAQMILPGIRTVQVGMCRMIDHPKWGMHCYPATMFTNLSVEQIKPIIESCL